MFIVKLISVKKYKSGKILLVDRKLLFRISVSVFSKIAK